MGDHGLLDTRHVKEHASVLIQQTYSSRMAHPVTSQEAQELKPGVVTKKIVAQQQQGGTAVTDQQQGQIHLKMPVQGHGGFEHCPRKLFCLAQSASKRNDCRAGRGNQA